MQIDLKYGLNPHQGSARVMMDEAAPLELLNGNPGYINILDALASWQLVRELAEATGAAAAASFKHVSPAGAAVDRPLTEEFRRSQFLPDEDLSPAARAYVRARGADRLSSFGDFVAVSQTVDRSLARVLGREVSDGIIAPGYEGKALSALKSKKKGGYRIFQIDPDYRPPEMEHRDVFGMRLEEERNTAPITPELFEDVVVGDAELPPEVLQTLIVATITLKYTQSNNVCVALDGQVIGNGAGQQSRVHCTRLACSKADKWLLQQHPRVLGLSFKEDLMRAEKTNVVDQFLLWEDLSEAERQQVSAALTQKPVPLTEAEREDWIGGYEGICMSSDAFFPFRDSIDRASRTNVQYIAQPGGSLRDESVTAAAEEYGMWMCHTDLRLFLH